MAASSGFELYDFAKLKSTLANDRTLQKGDALYQTILGLIDGSQSFQKGAAEDFDTILGKLKGLGAVINVVEADTGSGPVTYDLAAIVTGMTVVKDATGNAGANNITLTGTVEGVVDPVINTNFGIYRVYVSPLTGAFLQW